METFRRPAPALAFLVGSTVLLAEATDWSRTSNEPLQRRYEYELDCCLWGASDGACLRAVEDRGSLEVGGPTEVETLEGAFVAGQLHQDSGMPGLPQHIGITGHFALAAESGSESWALACRGEAEPQRAGSGLDLVCLDERGTERCTMMLVPTAG